MTRGATSPVAVTDRRVLVRRPHGDVAGQVTTWLRRLAIVSISAAASACGGDPGAVATTTEVTTPGPSVSSFEADVIPVDTKYVADTGCLDEAGTLRGHASDWYQIGRAHV